MKDIYRYRIIDYIDIFGERNQILKTIEELGELQKELLKYLNDGCNRPPIEDIINNIKEERTDVEIMLMQIDEIFGITEADINKVTKNKIDKADIFIKSKQKE